MPVTGPKAKKPPYSGRFLTPEYEEENKVGGRVTGGPYIRWYTRDELILL